MRASRLLLSAIFLGACAIFWIPAPFFPVETKNATNVILIIAMLWTSLALSRDVIEIIRDDGRGISWQAAFGKIGIFTVATSVGALATLSLVISFKSPDDALAIVQSPIGAFLRALQALGMSGLLVGLSAPDTLRPQVNVRLAVLVAALAGLVIGIVISHVPIIPD